MDQLNRSVIEAASWRLASTIIRRHTDLSLIRMHPAGGTYDVLRLYDDRGTQIMLNRAGTIQVHGRCDGRPPAMDPVEWTDYLRAFSPMAFVERIERAAGLPEPVIGALTRPAIVFKTIAYLTALGTLSEPFDVSAGFVDSSGQCGSFDADWWDEMLTLEPELTSRTADDPFEMAGHRFFRVQRSDFQMTFETTTCSMWPELNEDLGDIADDPYELAKYREDLVEYASLERLLDEFRPKDPNDHFSAIPMAPWPSTNAPESGANPTHEIDPMLRVLQAVLELGRR